jgi:hypothetical protein
LRTQNATIIGCRYDVSNGAPVEAENFFTRTGGGRKVDLEAVGCGEDAGFAVAMHADTVLAFPHLFGHTLDTSPSGNTAIISTGTAAPPSTAPASADAEVVAGLHHLLSARKALSLTLALTVANGGKDAVRLTAMDGSRHVGTCVVPATGGWASFVEVRCALRVDDVDGGGGEVGLALALQGGDGSPLPTDAAAGELLRLDRFTLQTQ